MEHRIITISREFGSGGRTIGRELAARLGIPCYDAELLEQIAQASGYAREFVAEQGEYALGGSWFGQAFTGRTCQDDLWAVQNRVVRELAQKGPCVIVGRCADYILREEPGCLRVFIHADMESRARRIVEKYGERSDSPEKRRRDRAKRRAAYYQFSTDIKWGEARNYHITLNSGALGLERCVDILAGLC